MDEYFADILDITIPLTQELVKTLTQNHCSIKNWRSFREIRIYKVMKTKKCTFIIADII